MTCSIDTCDRPVRARGWCSKHWQRWSKHGDPLAGARIERDPVCTVDGCEKPHQGRGYCAMHLERVNRHGDPGPVLRIIADRGTGSVMANGYRVLTSPGHPLAGAQDKVYEHRLVLFEAIGPDVHPCHWCGLELRWDGRWPGDPDALVVDHLDFDRLNNDRANLVPSCSPCNTRREDTRTEVA